jgi:hypothetical protein
MMTKEFLGALDWNNAARKHDALLLKLEKNKLNGDLGFAFNQNSEKVTGTFFSNSGSQPYKSMEFLWIKYKISEALSFSGLAINLDFQNQFDSSISHLQTAGGNIFYKKGKWNVTGTYYYQHGKSAQKSASSTKTNAWMGTAKIDYAINKKASAGIGSDYLTGAKNSGSTQTYFNPLYGTHHKFYGFMDYFYLSSAHKNAGLWDSYLNLNVKPTTEINMQLALHHFEAASKIVDYRGRNAGSTLGNEADLTLNYQIMKDVKLSGGYSQMFTAPSMKYVKNILPDQQMKTVQNWVWLSLNINTDILIFKRETNN